MYRYICGLTLLFKQPWFQSFYFNIWRRQSVFNLLNTWQNDFFMKRHFEKNITAEVNMDSGLKSFLYTRKCIIIWCLWYVQRYLWPNLTFKQPWFQSFYFNIWRRQSAFNLLNTWQNDFFTTRHFEKNIWPNDFYTFDAWNYTLRMFRTSPGWRWHFQSKNTVGRNRIQRQLI